MNKVILKGRLTKDPDVRYTEGGEPVCISRFTLACEDRERAKEADGSHPANFIPCVCMGKLAEIAEANLCKGKEILICGKMQSGSYTDKEGKKIYTLSCWVQEIEYCGKKSDGPLPYDGQGFMNIPDNLDDELPFG